MKHNYIDGFSILIPSYNRKDQLCRLFNSIFKEDISTVYEIVVIDNNSDYNIYEVLSKYSSEKIRIVRNNYNVGQAVNMVNTFLHCKTKWMWLISDDDTVIKDSISKINNRIQENSDVGYLKFSTSGIKKLGIERDVKVKNLEEFIDYYTQEKVIRTGNLIFVSNGVFNLELLDPYIGRGFEFSYTYVGFLIPVFFALKNNTPVRFCDESIVKYVNPENGTWSFSKVGLGLSTLSHLPLLLNKIYFKKFLRMVTPIHFQIMFEYLVKNYNVNNRLYYSLIYHNSYKYYLNKTQKIQYYIFSFFLYFPRISNFILNIFRKNV